MMLTVNGASRDCEEGLTVDALVVRTTEDRQVAVAVNGEVVPRGRWDSTRLRDGDAVELLSATAGG